MTLLPKLVADVSGRGGDLLPSCQGQVDQASQASTAGVQGKMHRYIYQSIRKLVIISPPSPPRLIQLTPGPEDCTIQTDGRRQDGPIMADRDLTWGVLFVQ